MRKISDNGLRFTSVWESPQLLAYRATPAEKYLTIGFGHYGPDVKSGDKMTLADAYLLLRKDMAKAEAFADRNASASLNQSQFDAICDICFNVGLGIIEKDNILGDFDDAVRDGDIPAIRKKLMEFIYQNKKPLLGLKRRATARLALFDGDDWATAESKGRAVKTL